MILSCVGAYLLGSIPTAVWIGKAFFGIDVREHGSGNAGATNTLRTLGKPAGFTVLFIDFLKGLLATSLVIFNHSLVSETEAYFNMQMLLGAMAVLGHVYPIFAGFKGGKGIATLIGVITAMSGWLALCCFVTFVIIVSVSKYISLGSMVSAILSPLYVGLIYEWHQPTFLYFCITIAVLVVYTHRANIGRLRAGNENKFSLNKKPTIETQKK
ncbi:MAG TPA: acyl-phosphate glycerol 3-phosphate acyltransferase [Bacteroidetes bacterium]|nr:acyl-phosphate glycerol 3-phosphate acyltransferase [Bacteroidota bacterium]